MRPIKNMKLAKNVNIDDVCEAEREFETTSGVHITVRALNLEYYIIREFQANIDQIVYVAISVRDVRGDHVADLKRLFMTQGMDNSLAGNSTALLHQQG